MDFDNLQQVTELAALPPPPPKPTPKWNGWSAPIRGLAAGLVAEPLAAVADSIKGYGQVMAATGSASAGGMFSTRSEAERRETEAQRARIAADGLDTDSNVGQSFRNVARDFRPDPATAGMAEKLAFDLPRFLGKAVGYTVLGGPAGPLMLGTDEAMQTADDLRLQGVDKATRQKVGALAGVAAAAGVVLPVAAPGSVAKTVGLWAVGGPGAFVAQQAATSEILAEANYAELAAQYDPLDPVGLAISSLVPAGFAAHAVIGARRAGATPRAAEQAPPTALTPEQLDAVMTHNLTLAQDVRDATSPADAAAMMRTAEPEPAPASVGRVEVEPAPAEPQVSAPGPARALADTLPLDPAVKEAVSPLVDAIDTAVAADATPTAQADPHTKAMQARIDEIERLSPDMVVGADAEGNPVTVAREMERIRREAIEGTDTELGSADAALLEIAANCALSTGAQ